MSAGAVEIALGIVAVAVVVALYLFAVTWVVSVGVGALVVLSPVVAVAGLAILALGLMRGSHGLVEVGAACFAGGGVLWWFRRR